MFSVGRKVRTAAAAAAVLPAPNKGVSSKLCGYDCPWGASETPILRQPVDSVGSVKVRSDGLVINTVRSDGLVINTVQSDGLVA